MIRFLLNDKMVSSSMPGVALLDFIRNEQHLKGSKLVCKEGECGACTVLVGTKNEDKITYQIMTSCIMPVVNAQGKHIVTIEGLNMEGLSPVQQAMVDSYGTQCGFCTPGFVVSLTGYLLSNTIFTSKGIIESMDGNICRCTGYKSIERAAELILEKVEKDIPNHSLRALVNHGYLPSYFKNVKKMMDRIPLDLPKKSIGLILGGALTCMYRNLKKCTTLPPMRSMTTQS